MGAPSFSRRGGGGGGGGAEVRGGAPIIRQWRRSNKKSDTADWGGGVERGSSIYEQGCNIKSATAFAVLAVASAPPM